MGEKISSEQAYVSMVMKKLPSAEKGRVHTMKSDDNLWNIAKKEINKKNAKNSEIRDYMLLIAKLNNLDTIEKMNGLKVSDKIYLPKINNAAKTVKANNSKTNVDTKNSAEASVTKLKNMILNDKTVYVEKMYTGYEAENYTYHVYNHHTYDEGYIANHHPIMSFDKNSRTGNITSICFDDQQNDVLRGKYDYEIDKNGNIHLRKGINNPNMGKVDKEELNELHEILKQKSKGMIRTVF